ncbi:BrnT family toxin [Pseudomonas japonica]|uniref:BrnT family toxin n=1 Tax=Pseudomonas japonica TaxID=256466 RepID=UPI003809936D
MYIREYSDHVFFEWDSEKNRRNFQKHGIYFEEVEAMFGQPMWIIDDCRVDYGEEREIGLGWLNAWVCLVVFTERRGDVIRIISARRANKEECRRYAKTYAS